MRHRRPSAPDLRPLVFLLPSPYSGSTVGKRSFSGNICGPPIRGREGFSYDLGPGEEIRIGYSTVSEWSSVGSLGYGGASPGDTHVGCLVYNSNVQDPSELVYQNLGTSAVAVYFEIGYSGSVNPPEEGGFVLEWTVSDIPTASPTPVPSKSPTIPGRRCARHAPLCLVPPYVFQHGSVLSILCLTSLSFFSALFLL